MALDSLVSDEWIILQVKEGPCSAGCTYCYESGPARARIHAAQASGILSPESIDQLDAKELAAYIRTHREKLNLEMGIPEIRNYFTILHAAGITRVGLIGSEPTQHRDFSTILSLGGEQSLSLLVYTTSLNESLAHPSVSHVVYHVPDTLLQHSRSTADAISRFVAMDKRVDLRVNFRSMDMTEVPAILSLYEHLPKDVREKVLLKYSFSTRVEGDSGVKFVTPVQMRANSRKLIDFVSAFKSRFPEARMYAERPLFRCAFDAGVWEEYERSGEFTSKCVMEYVIYAGQGITFCPPGKHLQPPLPFADAPQLWSRIHELRNRVYVLSAIPSFPECEPCEYRKNDICQGGCLGYKTASDEK
jgi:hypothetical protein